MAGLIGNCKTVPRWGWDRVSSDSGNEVKPRLGKTQFFYFPVILKTLVRVLMVDLFISMCPVMDLGCPNHCSALTCKHTPQSFNFLHGKEKQMSSFYWLRMCWSFSHEGTLVPEWVSCCCFGPEEVLSLCTHLHLSVTTALLLPPCCCVPTCTLFRQHMFVCLLTCDRSLTLPLFLPLFPHSMWLPSRGGRWQNL